MLGVVMDVILLDVLDEVWQLLQAVAMATPRSQASVIQVYRKQCQVKVLPVCTAALRQLLESSADPVASPDSTSISRSPSR